jgi:fatty acid desaturase
MKKNMGNTDRLIRIVLAVIFAILYFTNTVTGTFGIILLILGGVFLLTSFISFCPLYTLIGLNTCPAKKNQA